MQYFEAINKRLKEARYGRETNKKISLEEKDHKEGSGDNFGALREEKKEIECRKCKKKWKAELGKWGTLEHKCPVCKDAKHVYPVKESKEKGRKRTKKPEKELLTEPAFVKTPADEKKWAKAKAAAKKQDADDFYALANHIYHKMKGESVEEGSWRESFREDLEEAESKTIAQFRNIVKRKSLGDVAGQPVDMTTANIVLQVYDALNDANKKKLEGMSVLKMINTALKVANKTKR